MSMQFLPLYLALVHYPVLNRRGEVIASALTNFDLHDLARLVCTYDLRRCYIATPLEDQHKLARKLISHWVDRAGGVLHPDRGTALKRLEIVEQVRDAVRDIEREWGKKPRIWATSAKKMPGAITWAEGRAALARRDFPVLLLLGTGWGLAPEIFEAVDEALEPIVGLNGYNHLSVRCAAAIMLDRLAGAER